jgi:hypothetical protein
VLAVAVAATATAAGVGWLYLLFQWGALGAGPHVTGALPLQQLAGNESQPLLRVVVAWLPAGAAAGAALAGLTRLRWLGRAAVVALVGWAVLFASGAISDAIALNERVDQHLGPQLHSTGTWTAVGLMVIGSLLTAPAAAARARARGAIWR